MTQTTDVAELAAERAEALEGDMGSEYLITASLDYEFTVDSSGRVKEITVTTTTGGPHVEVALYDGTVTVSWGSEAHTAPVFDKWDSVSIQRAREFFGQRAEELGLEVTYE
jgi:hypothetical protein